MHWNIGLYISNDRLSVDIGEPIGLGDLGRGGVNTGWFKHIFGDIIFIYNMNHVLFIAIFLVYIHILCLFNFSSKKLF